MNAGPQELRARRLARDLGCEVLVASKTGNVRAVTPSGARWRWNGLRVMRLPLGTHSGRNPELAWEAFGDRMARGIMVAPSARRRAYS